MATVRDITSMCREGRIKEAYDLAIADWEAEPTNAWSHRKVGWALYYQMRADAERGDYDALIERLDKLKSLDLLTPEGDKIIFENVQRALSHYFRHEAFISDNDALQKLSCIIQKLEELPIAQIGVQREAGWALYFLIKADTENGNFNSLIEHLKKLKSLDLLTPEGDKIIFENVQRAVGHYFRHEAFISDNEALQKLSCIIQKLQELPIAQIGVQREAGWALYFLMKADAESGNYNLLIEHLEKLKSLDLLTPEGAGDIFGYVLFYIGMYIKNNVFMDDPSAPAKLSTIFHLLRDYKFSPSKGYSFVLQSYIKFVGIWNEIADFLKWWNLDNLTQEDYTPFENQRGQKMMTLAERAFIANSKALLSLKDPGRIEEFLPEMDNLMNAHPEMTYPGYFYGKLLLSLGGNEEEALKVIIPFARRKASEFWVWQLISDVFVNDPEKQLACLLRAVNCRTQEMFLGKVRIKLANIYVTNHQYDKARFHIDKVVRCHMDNGWRLPPEINNWIHEPWLNNATPNGNADMDYMAITNAILCEGSEEAIAVVTYFDQNSKRVAMVYGHQKRHLQKLHIRVSAGDVLKINYIVSADGKINVLHAVKTALTGNLSYAKVVQGAASKRDDWAFAFLRDGEQKYFIRPNMVQKYHVTDGMRLKSLVVYDYDNRREMWNWACVSINRI